MIYANGDKREGYFADDAWKGAAVYTEAATGETWHETWNNGSYFPSANFKQSRKHNKNKRFFQVKIYKRVQNNYENVSVDVICKVHGQEAIPVMYKEGSHMQYLDAEINGEIGAVIFHLPFGDEYFKEYSCTASAYQSYNITKKVNYEGFAIKNVTPSISRAIFGVETSMSYQNKLQTIPQLIFGSLKCK